MKTVLILLIAAISLIAGLVIHSKNGEISELQASINQLKSDLSSINQQMLAETRRREIARANAQLVVQEFQKSMERTMLPTIVPEH